MRYLLFMIPNISDEEWAQGPAVEAVQAMTAFNEQLSRAGVLLAVDGLHPTSEGARVTAAPDGGRVVTDGPFAEAKEVVGGYWVIQAASREEAVEWARRIPLEGDAVVEVRRVYDLEDHSPDVQQAAALSVEPPAQAVAR